MGSPGSIFWIALGGSLGALSRYGIAALASRWQGSGFAIGTLAANLLGCFLMGLLIGSGIGERFPAVKFSIGVGFLGSLTTFSTFSADTLAHLQQQQYVIAAIYATTSVLAGVLLAFIGMAIANAFRQA